MDEYRSAIIDNTACIPIPEGMERNAVSPFSNYPEPSQKADRDTNQPIKSHVYRNIFQEYE